MTTPPIIEVTGLKNQLGDFWVHTNVNLSINQGDVVAIIGGSGSGKTTLLKSLLMLLKPTDGCVKLFDEDIYALSPKALRQLRKRFGVLFQHSALFSSLNVLENVMFPMREFTHLPEHFMKELALLKINLVGLPAHAAYQYPSELSGGMQRRAAAARAIAMDPDILFLDEPTTGLDPRSARRFDELIIFLHQTLKLTIVLISHDLESLKTVPTKIAFIGEGEVLACEPYETLINNPHPMIKEYFHGGD